MERARLRPRFLVAIVVAAALIIALIVGVVVSTSSGAQVVRHGAGYTDPQTEIQVPPSFAGVPIHTATASLSREDTRTLTSEPWQFIRLDGDKLELLYVAGDGAGYCVVPRGFAVTYSTTAVEVWALSETKPVYACEDSLKVGHAILTLPQPLNGRKLVHAPTDQAWRRDVLLG